ncbi:hypothetical protein ET445_14565 [Agromyces protaetiae]|uniref:Uncharacterized protein n=1 Tax=Agromyces protaetiae TaxID=2509455 RepID=A0A4P6FDT8_9MICO|nr:hypothetical protein [Agromyces protaetiae]QAY74370.1 hypothetical protein ET445_14565 [Agromyces protaetiae]
MTDRRDPRESVFAFIAFAIIAAFVVIWAFVILQTLLTEPATGEDQVAVSSGLTSAAGAITTLLATRTASVLGFAATSREAPDGTPSPQGTVAGALTGATKWAIGAYLVVGIAVVITWLYRGAVSPQVVAAFALGVFGWLGSAAAIVFAARSTAGARQSGRAPL